MKRYLLLMTLFGLSVSSFAQNGKARRSDGTECAALPCVVATVSLTDQSQAIRNTPIFTPVVDGIFRITPYITTSSGTNQRAQWVLFYGWTDQNGAKKSSISAPPNVSTGVTFPVQDLAAQNIFFQTKLIGGGHGSGGMTYSVYITIEQLQ